MPLPMQKLVLGLRERYCKPINIKKNSTEMTILHISDTHNLHHKITSPLISKADILIHSGDITNNGTEQEVLDFLNWFISLPDAHKILVTGDHDTCLLDAEKIDDLP